MDNEDLIKKTMAWFNAKTPPNVKRSIFIRFIWGEVAPVEVSFEGPNNEFLKIVTTNWEGIDEHIIAPTDSVLAVRRHSLTI
jgi:hypothetical protein